jgi:hypothetical protein
MKGIARLSSPGVVAYRITLEMLSLMNVVRGSMVILEL